MDKININDFPSLDGVSLIPTKTLSPSMRKPQNRWYFVVCGWLNIQMLWNW